MTDLKIRNLPSSRLMKQAFPDILKAYFLYNDELEEKQRTKFFESTYDIDEFARLDVSRILSKTEGHNYSDIPSSSSVSDLLIYNMSMSEHTLAEVFCASAVETQHQSVLPLKVGALVEIALNKYVEVLDAISDPRVSDWPLMDSPVPTVALVIGYLYVVLFLGPRVMANRKPFRLNRVLVLYNASQVIFSLIMLWEHLMSGWLLEYSYKCQPVDYSHSPKAMRMATLCWWYYISKLTEFIDTVFFVLRKKDNQISLLHLYHHSLTPLETWICVKFIAGGHGTFSNLINNFVHVVMYFYYMMAAMGPKYQKYLWWKKHLTSLQLLQFTLVFFHSAQVLVYDCGYPKLVAVLLLIHSIIFFVLFSDFYIQAYMKKIAPRQPFKLKSS